jgi:predicted transcriptional regulator
MSLEKPDLCHHIRFLDVLYTNGSPMRKTNLQMVVGLNHPRFMEYLEWLLQHDLVTMVKDEKGVERVALSSKGFESYHRLVEWIRVLMRNIKI